MAGQTQVQSGQENSRIQARPTSSYTFIKRGMDIIFSIVGLVVTLPMMVIILLFIVIESFGNPFFLQERVGLHGKVFKVIKLRSMRLDAEKNGAQWAEKNDSRVTKVGSFIRKTRIDEIPQFINILIGDMSLIGPRPERPIFTEKFEREIPGFRNRILVKPGLTGWAQVNGGYDITPKEKLQLDMYYMNHASLGLDVKIIWKTIGIVFTGEGAR